MSATAVHPGQTSSRYVVGHGEANVTPWFPPVGPLVCVIDMALQTYIIWLNVDLKT